MKMLTEREAAFSVVSGTVLNAVKAIATLRTIILLLLLLLLSIHADVIEVHRLLSMLLVSCAATVETFCRLAAHVLAKRRVRIVSR